MDNIQLFEDQPIRTAWVEDEEEWYFSIVDVVQVLTEQPDVDGARNYWKVLKKRLKDEGSQLVTNCNQLKMKSCHRCGRIHPEMKDLRIRIMDCTCGCKVDRDYNAALNIKTEGLKMIAA